MSDLRMDSHKLIFHPKVVSEWLDGNDIFPISLEVSLSNSCNHRCIFCAVDYSEYKAVYLDKDIIINSLTLLSEKKLKSVVFSGEGEPLLNKNAPEIINSTKKLGIDIGLSTNGVLFTEEFSKNCLSSITWVRFSVAAGSAKTYSKIHSTKESDFDRVLNNIATAVKVKKENNLTTTIGVQLLLLPENADEVILLAKTLSDIGVDYFTVKPYSQHPGSINKHIVDYDKLTFIGDTLKNISTDTYKIYFRQNAMSKLSHKREYNRCYALEFFTHIDAYGNLIPCIQFLGNNDYVYGNLYNEDIISIWEKRKNIIAKINDTGTTDCKKICRLDEMNRYLNELLYPNEHVNFI